MKVVRVLNFWNATNNLSWSVEATFVDDSERASAVYDNSYFATWASRGALVRSRTIQ